MYLAAKWLGRNQSADKPTTAIVRLVRRMRRRVAMSSAMVTRRARARPRATLTETAPGDGATPLRPRVARLRARARPLRAATFRATADAARAHRLSSRRARAAQGPRGAG